MKSPIYVNFFPQKLSWLINYAFLFHHLVTYNLESKTFEVMSSLLYSTNYNNYYVYTFTTYIYSDYKN